ncbi:MAG TPA: alanine--tRNA ligase [Thermodesulfovibrionales bacterium]|nr:alanine--tRNA ligase [Thermodesulfovibrionales bacterium]
MKSAEIRSAFLEFFREKGHEPVRSSPLIPKGDPTLLFTNAGMVQFKSVFLGKETRPYKRAASCQKCMRAGGKHSDIENVGHTARHHTFFEMLGNFSFGDYFKRDAILFAWELLIERFRLPKERLWATVFENDDEAEKLWRELTGIPAERIVRLGAKDNFWQMGDTGPCGPCSEIIIDQGEGVGCGRPDCAVGCDCDRFLEIWNLVFMQFNRDEKGTLTPLPKPSIDTGMGLERVSAVLQGKLNNFDTDLFSPIISAITERTGVEYGRSVERDTSIRIIADHIRSIAFLLSEGLMPSNEGRGYVLRRIIRRASRHARLLGIEKPVLFQLIDSVSSAMGSVYPELPDETERSSRILMVEEERFERTLEQGMKIMDDLVGSLRKSGLKTIPGNELFKLYDTFGFPLDLARDIASDNGLMIDEEGFLKEMEIQRERARASWVGEEEGVASIYRELLSEVGKTEFIGYESLEGESVIRAILREGKVMKEASEGMEVEIFLDRTPFYGESGGQVGDTGEMTGQNFRALVLDTKKPLEGLHAHVVKIRKGLLRVWDKVECRVDAEKRRATMKNHTATHLLHEILRSVLGDHVKQAGSLVSPERLRFDFTHFSSLDDAEVATIETRLVEKVIENLPVVTSVSDIKTAIDSGATALFGEKYGEMVRVVSVPGFSSELCGGTHCKATGEIGFFVIVSEGSVASGIRRIEALTGREAFRFLKDKVAELRRINELLKTDKASARIERLLADMRTLEKELEAFKFKAAAKDSSSMIEKAKSIDGILVLSCRVDGLEQKDLRVLADNIRDRMRSGIICMASAKDGQASILTMVTRDLTDRFNAGEILKKVSALTQGRGGGKAEMAQGGTSNLEKLDSALESVYDIVEKSLQGADNRGNTQHGAGE